MVVENREGNEVDAETGSHALEFILDPALTMIVVLTGDGIVSHQITTSHDSADRVDNRDFVWREDLDSSDSCHDFVLYLSVLLLERITGRSS